MLPRTDRALQRVLRRGTPPCAPCVHGVRPKTSTAALGRNCLSTTTGSPRTHRHSYSRPGSLRKYSTVRATPSSKGTNGVHPAPALPSRSSAKNERHRPNVRAHRLVHLARRQPSPPQCGAFRSAPARRCTSSLSLPTLPGAGPVRRDPPRRPPQGPPRACGRS